MKVYKTNELFLEYSRDYNSTNIKKPEFEEALKKAELFWLQKTEQAYEKYGDTGACIMGEGLYLWIVPPRCRNPRRMRVLRSPSNVQGEVVKLAGMGEARDLLASLGFETEIDHGRMD